MSKEIHHILWSTTKWLSWVWRQCRSLTWDSLARLLPSPFSPSILVLSLCRTLFFQGSLFLFLALLRSLFLSLPPPTYNLPPPFTFSLSLSFAFYPLTPYCQIVRQCNVYSLQLYTPKQIAWNDKEYIEQGIKETQKSCTLLHTH